MRMPKSGHAFHLFIIFFREKNIMLWIRLIDTLR